MDNATATATSTLTTTTTTCRRVVAIACVQRPKLQFGRHKVGLGAKPDLMTSGGQVGGRGTTNTDVRHHLLPRPSSLARLFIVTIVIIDPSSLRLNG